MPYTPFQDYYLPKQPERQSRPFDPAASVTTAFGTTAESAIDVATFGILHPDIIPEAMEQQHPWATTIGRIVGSIVGFVTPGFGSLTTTGRALKGAKYLSNYFRFANKAIGMAEATVAGVAATGKIGSVLAGGGVTFGRYAATFALHDTAREIVRQVKEQDPDLYTIGKRALQGGITGGMLGFTGMAVGAEHPIVQAFSIGSTMALAETLNDIGDGEDVFSAEYVTQRMSMSFLQGTVIGLFNSKGYKDRRRLMNNGALESGMRLFERDPNKYYDQMVKQLELAIPKKELPAEFKNMLKNIKVREQKGFSADPKKARQELATLFKRDLKMTDEVRHEYMKAITGKESSKDFTPEDFIETTKSLHTLIENKGVDIKLPGPIQQHFSPADRLFIATGIGDIASMRNLKLAKEMQITMERVGQDFSYAMKRAVVDGFQDPSYRGAFKESIKTRTGKAVRGKPSLAAEEFGRHVNYNPKLPISQINQPPTTKLTPQLKKYKELYNQVGKLFADRQNEVLAMMGMPKMELQEVYMRHLIDAPAMIRAGMSPPKSDPEGIWIKPKVAEKFTVSTEMKRTATPEKYIYKTDPFAALEDMVRTDLKRIYLTRPQEIAATELKHMRKIGQINQAEHDYIANWANIVVRQQPTTQTRNLDNFIRRKFETKPGKAVEKYFAYFGREITSPTTMLSNLYGELVTKAYMGGRVRLALRNSLQMMFTHSFTDTKHLAKAMTDNFHGKEQPSIVKEYRDNSSVYKISTMQSLEHAQSRSWIDQLMHGPFSQSHINNVSVTSSAVINQSMEYIWNPKYHKLNWATTEGIDMRSKLKTQGNKDWKSAITDVEKARVFQEADYLVAHTQFLYNVLGMPMITRSKVAAPFFKLASFPMNYWYKYLGESVTRMSTGSPGWAKGQNIKLPWQNRYGIVKHLAVASAVIAGADLLGLDYSSISGFGFLPQQKKAYIPFMAFNFEEFGRTANAQGERLGFGERVVAGLGTPEGVLTARPTVAMSAFRAMVNLFSNDRYLKQKAIRDLPGLLVPIPGAKFVGDIKRAAREGDQLGFFAYKAYTPPKKKPGVAFPAFPAFKSF